MINTDSLVQESRTEYLEALGHVNRFGDCLENLKSAILFLNARIKDYEDQRSWAAKKLAHALKLPDATDITLERAVEVVCEKLK